MTIVADERAWPYPHYYGTEEDDYLIGVTTSNVELFYGYGGNDYMVGGFGHDRLYGGAGNDTLDGQEHYDTIYGGDGDDYIKGGGGDDWLVGDNRGSAIDGENDGDDFIRGDAGNDSIYGGGGDDELYGGAGHDHLVGGYGDDYLDAGDGDSYLSGGPGNDTFVFRLDSPGTTNIVDFTRGEDKILVSREDYYELMTGVYTQNIGEHERYDGELWDATLVDSDNQVVLEFRRDPGRLNRDDFEMPTIGFLGSRATTVIEDIRFLYDEDIAPEDMTVVGVFDHSQAAADKLKVVWARQQKLDQFGELLFTDEQLLDESSDPVLNADGEPVKVGVYNEFYSLRVKENETYVYDDTPDYFRIEYDGTYLGGGAIVVDL